MKKTTVNEGIRVIEGKKPYLVLPYAVIRNAMRIQLDDDMLPAGRYLAVPIFKLLLGIAARKRPEMLKEISGSPPSAEMLGMFVRGGETGKIEGVPNPLAETHNGPFIVNLPFPVLKRAFETAEAKRAINGFADKIRDNVWVAIDHRNKRVEVHLNRPPVARRLLYFFDLRKGVFPVTFYPGSKPYPHDMRYRDKFDEKPSGIERLE